MAVLAVEKKIIVIDIKFKVVSQIVIRFILSDVCFDIRISAQFIALDRVVKEIFYHFAIDELIAPFDLNSASALEDERS